MATSHNPVDLEVNRKGKGIARESDSVSMRLRGGWSRYATVIGALSCVMIALAFLVPWYGLDYDYYDGSSLDYRVEYSVGIEAMGDLMSKVTILLTLSLTASCFAVVLSYLRRRTPGVIAGVLSAGLLLVTGGVFYFGIIDALALNSFTGYSHLNRSWSVENAPMLGWWIAVTVPVVQGAQAIVLAYSED